MGPPLLTSTDGHERRDHAYATNFFTEEQLEAYRTLGFHIMKGLLTGEGPFCGKARPEGTG